ncbi:MAG: pyruvate formate-lyase-activating protein [Defluviitaleaceae bacterium]|nr:pyruvate formate-lyase-activating protein [Defluviitaleaceae bacterium]
MDYDYDKTLKGRVHSIFTGGMVDGPGIRCVVFFTGCPLRCKYCHNPDTWFLDNGMEMSVEEVLRELLKYKKFYKRSGGGVTFSGGEPLSQPEFLCEILKACRANKIHTCLDTSGFAPESSIMDVLPFVDLLLLDIKAANHETYKRVTGQKSDRIFAMLGLALRQHVQTWIRYVLVPGLTDNLDEIRKLADFLREYNNIEKVDILPFHKLGEDKWKDLGIEYELHDTLPPSPELIQTVREILTV